MIGVIRSILGRKPSPKAAAEQIVRAGLSADRSVRAAYEAARTTDENARHWALARLESANAAADSGVRERLRIRSRYEVANNSYAAGVVRARTEDVVGTGPRLQVLSRTGAEAIEAAFTQWWAAADMTTKLELLYQSRVQDGESFALFSTNPRLAHPVQLDIRLIEADQVTAPLNASQELIDGDGILYDAFGNPASYAILRDHPGGDGLVDPGVTYDMVPAEKVIHFYRKMRPGQSRGVPELTPALELFAMLRRYTLAVLASAEVAANITGVIHTDSPPEDPIEAEPWDIVELERRAFTTLPAGWSMSQLRAEQPTTGYAEFKRQVLIEIGRCMDMPANVILGDSSSYNYSSGRLDHQAYSRAIKVDRRRLSSDVLDRIYREFLREAVLVSGLLPTTARTAAAGFEPLPHRWFFDGREHVDPEKEARATSERLSNMTTTLADEYAARGQDWEVQIQQRAREKEMLDQLGLSPQQAMPPATPAGNEEGQDDG